MPVKELATTAKLCATVTFPVASTVYAGVGVLAVEADANVESMTLPPRRLLLTSAFSEYTVDSIVATALRAAEFVPGAASPKASKDNVPSTSSF